MRHELLNAKNWILLLLLCLFFDFGLAQTFTTRQDGNWSDPATWGGGAVPTTNSEVIINHQVVLNQTGILDKLEIGVSGVLNSSQNFLHEIDTVNVKGIFIQNGGEIEIKQIIIEGEGTLNQISGNINVLDFTIETEGNYSTQSAKLEITGDFIIKDDVNVNLESTILIVNGKTQVFGSLIDDQPIGDNRYLGELIVETGATFSSGSNSRFEGNITNRGNFNINVDPTINVFFEGVQLINAEAPLNIKGFVQVTGTSLSIEGNNAVTLGDRLNTTIPITNNNSSTVSIDGNLEGTGSWTNTSGSTLLYKGANAPLTAATFNADATNNKVIYNGGSFNIQSGDYYDLEISGSGNRTVTEDVVVAHDLTIFNGGMGLNSHLLTVNGTTRIQGGSLSANSFDGLILFNGGLELTDGGILNLGPSTSQGEVQFADEIINNGSGFFVVAPKITFINQDINISGTNAISFRGNVDINTGLTLNNSLLSELQIIGNLTGDGATWTQGPNSILRYDGSEVPMLDGDMNVNAQGNTVIYGLDGDQSIRSLNNSVTYFNLDLQGNTGIKSLAGDITILGDFRANTGVSFNVGSHNISLNGDWDNQGFLPNHRGELLLVSNGDAFRNPNDAIHNLTINRSNNIQLNSNLRIEGNLDLTDGVILITDPNDVLVFSETAQVAINNSNSFVQGTITKENTNGFVFPVGQLDAFGQSAGATPIQISDASTQSDFTARYFKQPAPLATSRSSEVAFVSQNEYWTLSSATPNSAKVGITWSPVSGVEDESDLSLVRFDDNQGDAGQWVTEETSSTSTPNTLLTNANLNTFGFFTLASRSAGNDLGNPPILPTPPAFEEIEVIESEKVRLIWADSIENNRFTHQYIIQRAQVGDAGELNYINIIDTLANTTREYTDETLISGFVYFYRIRSRNTFGESDPTAPLGVITTATGIENEWLSRITEVFPVPARDELNLRIDAPIKNNITLILMDGLGNKLSEHHPESRDFNPEYTLKLNSLSAGKYYLYINVGREATVKEFIKY